MAKKKSAKTLVVGSKHRKNFVKALNQFSAYGYSRFNVFNDFLHLSAITLANNSDPYNLANAKTTVDERESQYKNIIGKYKPELQNLFGEMLGEIILEMESYCPNHLTDVLGEMFMELDFSDQWKGQCFTPQSVCNMMGRINFHDADKVQALIDEKGFVTVYDGAVGGGALILGAANGMHEAGFNPQRQMLSVVNDLDERCVWMCYVQLSLYGLPAIVRRQNTLTLETYGAPWYTPTFIFDGWTLWTRRAFDEEQSPQEIESVPAIVEEPKLGQLSLF